AGGPSALQDVIPLLPENLGAAVIVVQHMPKEFTRVFAERLNTMSRLSVKEAEEGDPVVSGRVFVAPGGCHLSVRSPAGESCVIHLSDSPAGLLFRPSVDVAMKTISRIYQKKVLGVILTGMGCDGREGMASIKKFSGRTMAQDHESCVVDGMPGSAERAGVVDARVRLNRLAEEITQAVYAETGDCLRKGVRV
ncbi:MAG: chemotaxis protein CheB, partial [Deltaproteobacteria bacterium]|nr:chemotaxis protein CheB [Deltaproteobacteria bacterium]